MLAEFHWLRPEWLVAAPVVVIIALLLARGKLSSGNWQAVIDPALLPFVLSRAPGRGRDYRWWLMGLVGVVAVAALAGPAWQRIEQPVFRTQQALVVALDLSRSMDAQDIAPSRIVRAKLKVLDILERRKSGQTALVVYSANAFTVTPLTTDTDTIAALVNSLATDIMPSRGSYPVAAIGKARKLLEQAGVGVGEILLITDGGSSPAAEDTARELRGAGYTLSVLAVGTAAGAPIPRVSGGFVTDNRGKIAVPRLEAYSLRALAAAGGGQFAILSADNRDLDHLFSTERVVGVASDASLTTDRWREQGPWLLLLLLPMAALAFRRGWVLLLLVFVVPLPQAEAAVWDNLWLNKNQQAQKLLREGNARDAVALFDDTEWQAVARYRAGDFAASAAQFAEQSNVRNLYNLGNALAFQGELDAAIGAYEKALASDPDNDDAQYNLKLVKSLRKEQQQEQQNQGDDQQAGEDPGGEGEQSDANSDPDQQGSEGNSQSDAQESDAPQRGDEEMNNEDLEALQQELRRAAEQAETGEQPQQPSAAELAELRQQQEQQQALEQWLRRVPDDPGGLLRRKFRHQYQRYGKDQDGNSLWPDDEVQPW